MAVEKATTTEMSMRDVAQLHKSNTSTDKMMLKNLAQEKVWLDKSEYTETERVYYEKLSKKQENNSIEVVAIDCEMVGICYGNMLARVSIVNSEGATIYDKFVKPTEKVTDYRTPISGIRPNDIEHGEIFSKVNIEVTQILKNKLVIGHSLEHDFKVLKISHPKQMIRDTTSYSKFMQLTKGQKPSLKLLALHFLKASIQEGEHSSVEDAKAALQLYMLVQNDWESQLKRRSCASNELFIPNSANVQKWEKKDIEAVAINCDKIGTQAGNILARVSIVNSKGETIYDKFVKPTAEVKDYRTWLNGIRPEDVEHGEIFAEVKKEVSELLKNKLLIGHSLQHHLKILEISYPEHMLRDISMYPKFMKFKKQSLKQVVLKFLGVSIQEGEHRSLQNSKAALQLYMLVKNDWESWLKKRNKNKP